ncbi:MAG TPA: NADH-quinone oxidoreductase subunit M [Gemmatimonadaceae bacterium]|nr:NADH-quinone oxidoreductase subunit M [Gemmatimonadaceae bacterium]
MVDFLTSIGYQSWILWVLLALPAAGAVIVLVLGSESPGAEDAAAGAGLGSARWLALLFLLAEFVLSLGLWWTYDPSGAQWQAMVRYPWIGLWGATFTLGIDGIALVMILLTTFLMPLSVLGSWTSIRRKQKAYYALLLVLTTGMLGVFMALDLLLFYVMWEVMLVPMYFIIGIWGGERRIYASLKFFIYTMLGSLLMLVAILYLWVSAGSVSFDYEFVMENMRTGHTAALWMFGAFFLAFAVKVPMFPFHTWLPDAHTEAPTAGSVILAGIMLKMGTYGFLRFAMPFFPEAALEPWVRMTILGLAVVGIIYGALVAMVQPDFKKLVAYSSVSHLGFVMLGIYALTLQSVQGAIMVMINHGISTGALFLLVGMIYERRHSRLIDAYGGIAKVVPMFAALLTFVSLSSIGLPGTNGFVGEFLVLVGSFDRHPFLTTLATTGVIFAAAYLLWAIQRILFNPLDKPENAALVDLNARELGVMMALVAAIIWIGIYPAPFLRRTETSAARFIEQVESPQRTSVDAASPRLVGVR